MSRRPQQKDPPHRLDDYAFRVGVLLESDDRPPGHILALPKVYWCRVGGHLWWRRWGDPKMTVDLYTHVAQRQPPYRDAFYRGDQLDELLVGFEAGQVREEEDTYSIAWLPGEASGQAALEVLGTDLGAERRNRAARR